MSSTPLKNFKVRIQKINYTSLKEIHLAIEAIQLEIEQADNIPQRNDLTEEKALMEKLLTKLPIRSQALILRGQEILLIKCFGKRHQDYFYTLPGGGLLHGESPELALHREIDEELGTTVRIEHSLPIFYNHHDDDFYFKYHTFICYLEDSLPTTPSSIESNTEILELVWMPLDAIQDSRKFLSNKLQVWPAIHIMLDQLIRYKRSESHS